MLSERIPTMDDEMEEELLAYKADNYTLYSDDESGEEKVKESKESRTFDASQELSTSLHIPCSCLVIGTEFNCVLHCSLVPKGEAHAEFEPALRQCIYDNFVLSKYYKTGFQVRTDGLGKNKNIASKVIHNLCKYCRNEKDGLSKLYSPNNDWYYDLVAWEKLKKAVVCFIFL